MAKRAAGVKHSRNDGVDRLSSEAPRMSRRREGIVLLAIVVAFSSLTAVPYLVAALRAPDSAHFTGLIFNPYDQSWYLTTQRSAAERLERANRSTTEVNAPALVAPIYPAVGLIKRLTGWPDVVAYHLPRLLAALALPLLTWAFFRLCLAPMWRLTLLATVVSLFSVGAGSLLEGLPSPIVAAATDSAVTESNVLLSTIIYPHFAVAQAGLLLLFIALLLAMKGRWQVAIPVSAAGALTVSMSHTFMVVPFFGCGAVIVGTLLARSKVRRLAFSSALPGLAPLATAALVAGPFLIKLRNESARFTELEGASFPRTPSGPWWSWLLGYGALVPLALLGLIVLAKRRPATDALLLIVWLAVQVPLIWLLPPFERRYSEGLVFPLVGLASVGLVRVSSRFGASPNVVTAFVVGALAFGATVASVRIGFTGFYLDDDRRAVAATLGRDDIVLAGNELSWILPAQSSATAYLGRDAETVANTAKLMERAQFVARPNSLAAIEWLEERGINTLVVELGDRSFDPGSLAPPCYQLEVARGRERIYSVKPQCRTAPGGPRSDGGPPITRPDLPDLVTS